jgi:hypothetical protein
VISHAASCCSHSAGLSQSPGVAFQQAFNPSLPPLRKAAAFQVKQGIAAEHVIRVRRAEDFQKVDAALALGGEERGEELVADVQRVPALALMPGAGVVRLKVLGDLARRWQQGILFPVERLMPLRQDPADLPAGNGDAQVRQLLSNQRLRNLIVVILVQHERAQRGPTVTLQMLGAGGDDRFPVGQLIPRTPIANVERLQAQLLDDKALVAQQPRPRRNLSGLQHFRMMDRQLLELGALVACGPPLATFLLRLALLLLRRGP